MPELAKLLLKSQTIPLLGSLVEFCVGMGSEEERKSLHLLEIETLVASTKEATLIGQGVDPASFLRRGEGQAMAMK